MGRLVEPLSKEEFEKLPKWQQWISNYWYILIGGIFVVFVALIVLNVCHFF